MLLKVSVISAAWLWVDSAAPTMQSESINFRRKSCIGTIDYEKNFIGQLLHFLEGISIEIERKIRYRALVGGTSNLPKSIHQYGGW